MTTESICRIKFDLRGGDDGLDSKGIRMQPMLQRIILRQINLPNKPSDLARSKQI